MDEALLADIAPPQRLALAYAGKATRLSFAAVFALDARLAKIIRARREVVLVQMRLAWWRDMLARPVSEWPKGDAVLGALRQCEAPDRLGALVDGWEALLAEEFGEEQLDAYCAGRQAAFAFAGGQGEGAAIASDRVSLVELLPNLSSPEERSLVADRLDALEPTPKMPRAQRPLAVLDGLANRAHRAGRSGDLLAGPGDMVAAIRLGLLGR
ncbi:hypothetical protein [Paraurantiacibacter namhicola]|uniref:Squalene/phytoene synthase n=1 Tax=Paraurantiacibacter namhicola TaxID=645517 RepID=A0A1C7D978_9SPHN|nr:hypothetical protein [Paraurantiacibacter namhicola]ANU08039.1 hypothetical protein A6F65_01742 [Paraurantiacibacter namhicola]